jgi:hypothetical protein
MTEEFYAIRGKRVPYLSDRKIAKVADAVANLYRINKKAARYLDMLMEDMQHGPIDILIDIVEDTPSPLSEVVRAACDPMTATITIPESLYIRITDGDRGAVHIFFHELGHLFLLHDPTLHLEPGAIPTKNEDSEYQADRFADRMMEKIGLSKTGGGRQLELFQ